MKKVVLTLLIVVAVAVLALAEWTGNSGDQKISYFPGTTGDFLSRFPKIVAYDNGILYSAWLQGKTLVPYEVCFSKSTDNGRTWNGSAQDFMISANDGEGSLVSGERPLDMAISSTGDVFIVWAESLTNVGHEIMLLRSTDGGTTWDGSSSDFSISFGGGPRALEPAIAVDINDNLHVVWHQRPNTDTTEILYGFSSDNGVTWTSQMADRVISYPDGAHANYPEIAVDVLNNVYVVWAERVDPTDINSASIHYGKLNSGDTQFNCELADYTTALPHRSATTPQIAIGPDNSIHVVFEGRNDIGGSFKGAIYYSKSVDGGVNWTGLVSETFVDRDAMDDTTASDPTVTVTSQGDIAVSYCNFDLSSLGQTETRLSLSFDGGATWTGNTTGEEIVGHWEETGDDRPGYNPHMCLSAGDTLHVVWNEDCMDEGGSSGYYEIMYSRGDTLGTPGGGPECAFVPGDGNGNGICNGLDVTYMVNYLKGGPNPPPIVCNCPSPLFPGADANGNCTFNGLDVTYLVNFLKGGPNGPAGCSTCL